MADDSCHEHQCWRQHPHGGMHECEHCDAAWTTESGTRNGGCEHDWQYDGSSADWETLAPQDVYRCRTCRVLDYRLVPDVG